MRKSPPHTDGPVDRRRHRSITFFTQDELRRLLDTINRASKRDYAIFLTAYRHGLQARVIEYCPPNAPAV